MDEARVRDIMRAICRIPVARGQQVLYKLLLEAEEAGLPSQAVRDALNLDQAAHRGLMAALTVRINNSPRELSQYDKPGLGMMIKSKWAGDHMDYWPLPEFREAVDRLPELRDRLRTPLEELRTSGKLLVPLPPEIDPEPPLLPRPAGEAVPVRHDAFSDLVGGLAKSGLHYPSELIANFILALQTKRFAILTGISGTGKTRIAQALAARYAKHAMKRTPLAVDDSRAMALALMPYMLKYSRFILPQFLVMQWPWLSSVSRGGHRITVTGPFGSHECAIYGGNAVTVLLSGPAKEWLSEEFASRTGALLVKLEGPDDQPSGLRIERAQDQVVESDRPMNYRVVAVRPDWTDSRGLLGYFNPITESYVSTPFLQLLLSAEAEVALAAEEDREPDPFFVVLDEMNIARVEHYFSDFLSALESGEEIPLHDHEELETGEHATAELLAIPRSLSVAQNLYFVGTVNVDESTYMFSPKVLDRAFTIELNEVHLKTFGGAPEWSDALDLTRWDGSLAPGSTRRPTTDDWVKFTGQLDGELSKQLIGLHDVLAVSNRHFGYRVANEIARFVNLAIDQGNDAEQVAWTALDLAILQKVLVKIAGTQQELDALLRRLLVFALVGLDAGSELGSVTKWKMGSASAGLVPLDAESDAEPLFPRSAVKVWRMRQRLEERGFTAWIE